jgi:predicted nucleotidyltransferase
MVHTQQSKDALKKELLACLAQDSEICRIIVFGSFSTSSEPSDMDVAILQDSDEGYLSLALKYRRQTRSVSQRIPLDIVPIRNNAGNDPFLREIEAGETIYER